MTDETKQAARSLGVKITERDAAEVAIELRRIKDGLIKPFEASEIKVKPAKVQGNRALALHYVDARAVMDRLDDVVEPWGWHDEYTLLPSGEVECRLSIKFGSVWITKADVGSQSEQPDEGDRLKAAYSDALKRAAVKFGIGRHLYSMPQEWMDYDQQRKRIIRPQDRQATAAKPASGKNPLAENIAAQWRNARSREEGKTAYEQMIAGKKSGALSDDDMALLNVEFLKFDHRFPRQT